MSEEQLFCQSCYEFVCLFCPTAGGCPPRALRRNEARKAYITRTPPQFLIPIHRLEQPFGVQITDGSRELLLPASCTQLDMAAPEVHHLFHHPIADHSFSADRKTLAVARDNQVELYSKSGGRFVLHDELKGHDKTVTSVDIAPTTGRIVSCSQGMSM